jgi:hypothetical protein
MFLSFGPTYITAVHFVLLYRCHALYSFPCPSQPMIPAAAKLFMAIIA